MVNEEKEQTNKPSLVIVLLVLVNLKTYQIDELREFELNTDGEDVAVVDNRSNDLVVIGEQVVVEALGVWIATTGQLDQQCKPAAYEQAEIDTGGQLTSHCCCCTNAVNVVANANTIQ
jgi:hypothetical protein